MSEHTWVIQRQHLCTGSLLPQRVLPMDSYKPQGAAEGSGKLGDKKTNQVRNLQCSSQKTSSILVTCVVRMDEGKINDTLTWRIAPAKSIACTVVSDAVALWTAMPMKVLFKWEEPSSRGLWGTCKERQKEYQNGMQGQKRKGVPNLFRLVHIVHVVVRQRIRSVN